MLKKERLMNKIYIAHIVIEAQTPLKVGSNKSDFLQDAPIQRDWNNLPMILGTSIAGVLRKDFNGDVKDIFGQDEGSQVIFSNALLVDEKGEVCEKLLLQKTPFLKIFEHIPIREHTAINAKGVAKDTGKYDEEVVYKGTRFKFSIEFLKDDQAKFQEIFTLLTSKSFRLGGGSTKGFGKFKIVEIKTAYLALDGYTSSLNQNIGKAISLTPTNSNYITYLLKLKPDDFFMFGSGFGDSDADMTPVLEQVVDYAKATLTEQQVLIPASSIKGAIAHRTAYHYNKKMLELGKDHTKTGENNDAVKAIFGHKKELVDDKKTELGQKGKMLISDCFKPLQNNTKTFDHVAIDRFSGGGIDGALFQEKTIAKNGENDWYEIEILLHEDIQNEELEAFESALLDITKGMLPLGGATTKGHGVFSGTVLRDTIAIGKK